MTSKNKRDIDSYFENKKQYGDKRIKISKTMLSAIDYARKDLGATWDDITEMISDVFNIRVTKFGLIKAYYRESKNKSTKESYNKNHCQVETETIPVESIKEIKKEVPDKANDLSVSATKKENGLIVLNNKKYKQKERCFDSGDENREKQLDALEERINNGEDIYILRGKDWLYYVCRYSEDPEYIKLVLNEVSLSSVPDKYLHQYDNDVILKKKKIYHLIEVS